MPKNMSMVKSKPKIIVILGPTASGKSDLAVKIAKHLSNKSQINSNRSRIFKNNSRERIQEAFERYNVAEVISADSRQVYKGLNIGSGKITKIEMRGIPHHLLDVASPRKIFTVSQYQKLAEAAAKKILKKNKIPIVCGGTGFYIDALIYDYQLPAVPPQPKLRKQLEKKSTGELFKRLKKLDPRRAKNIDCHNKRRLVRALEIILTTNKPVPLINTITRDSVDEKSIKPPHKPPYQILKIGIKKSPDELKKLINKRLMKRLKPFNSAQGKQGLIKEVENLHKNGLSWQRLDDLGLEYRYISYFLRQRALINAEKTRNHAEKTKIVKELKQRMIEVLEKEIYRYAKRQMTWFKKDKKIKWIENQKQAEKSVKEFLMGF